jgi:UDP-N-acetylglucosamine/UDP-N-acetylgalactosamine diphosphorylase/putative uridylyltransferase
MKKAGVQFVHINNVDNVLSKLADPILIGYLNKKNLDIAVKYIEKVDPEEKVGLLVLNKGNPDVREYTEMTKE